MIDQLVQVVAASNTEIAVPDEKSFRTLSPPPNVRWDVKAGGAVYAAGTPQLFPKTILEISGDSTALVLNDGSHFYGTRFIAAGRNCLIYVGKKCRLKGVIIKVAGDNCCVIIGDGTTIESGVILCGNINMNVIIGNHCMLSNDIVIRTDDGHGIFERQTQQLINPTQSVVLEPHVWIGNAARVNKGVRIGTGSVLGGSSIATSDLDPHCAYAGVPARKVRENIVWSRSFSYDDIPPEYR